MTPAIDASLHEFTHCLVRQPELDDTAALRADMCIGTTEQSTRLIRIMVHYRFAAAVRQDAESMGAIHRLGGNFFMFLLVLATNPMALRTDVFRRDHALV
jgi:hypothetical protein